MQIVNILISTVLCVLMQEESFEKLIETYLASIPAADQPQPLRLDRLTPLPVQFPEEVVKEDVRLAHTSASGCISLCRLW